MESIYNLISLKHKTAIITGADRGIGRAIALRFAEAGADLYITGLDETELDGLKKEIENKFESRVQFSIENLLAKDAAVQLIRNSIHHYPEAEILVNNAGIFPPTPSLDITDEEWDMVMSINLRSAFIASREFSKQMIERKKQGVILNILSISALKTAGNATHYVASKHALAGVTKSMAAELGSMGIRCLALAPGLIHTPGLQTLMDSSEVAKQSFEEYAKSLPLERAGKADDVACVALFAVSSLANYITGIVIPVDGGDLCM